MNTFVLTILLNSFQLGSDINKLQYFVESNEPTYIVGGDTLVVARLPMPSNSLNDFLFYCIENDIKEVDKYIFFMIMKLYEEFLKVNETDYDLCGYDDNGIVQLAVKRMDVTYDEIGCSFFKCNDVYLWLKANPDIVNSYQELKNQINKNEDLIKKIHSNIPR